MNKLRKLYLMSENSTNNSQHKKPASSSGSTEMDDDDRLRRLLAVCEEMSTTSDVSETAQPQKTPAAPILTFEKLDDDDDGEETTPEAADLSQIKADVSKCIQESILAIEVEQNSDRSTLDNEKNESENALKIDSPSSSANQQLQNLTSELSSVIENDDYASPRLAIDFRDDDDGDDYEKLSSKSAATAMTSASSSSSATTATKKRGGGASRRQPILDEDTLAALRIPMEVFGWTRELSYRSDGVSADVYYRSPDSSRKFRSKIEIGKYLTQTKSDELTLDHFSYAKRPLNCHNEFVRQCHGKNVESAPSPSTYSTPSSFKTPKREEKTSTSKKSKVKVVEKPVETIISTPKSAPTPKEKSPPPPSTSSSSLNANDNDKEVSKPSQKTAVKEKIAVAADADPPLFSEPLLVVKSSTTAKNASVAATADSTPIDNEKMVEEAKEDFKKALKVKIKQKSSSKKRKFVVDDDDDQLLDSKSSTSGRRSSSPATTTVNRPKTPTSLDRTAAFNLSKKKKFKSARVLSLERDFKLIKKRNFDSKKSGGTTSDKEIKSAIAADDDDESSTTARKNVNGSDEKKPIADDSTNDRGDKVVGALSDQAASDSTAAVGVAQTPPASTLLCRPNGACDERGWRDAICANCLLEFHVDCACRTDGRGGKMVAPNGPASKNAYFLCFSCYEELDIAYHQKSPSKSDENRREKLIEAMKMAAATSAPTAIFVSPSAATATPKDDFFKNANVFYDLLKKIFAHLSVQDLLRVRQVCRMWNDVAMLKEFWELAPLKGCQIKDWTVTSQFLRDRKVQTLDFFGVRTSVNAFVKSLEEMDYLTGLKFGHIVPLVLDVIKNCQKTLSNLETLRFTVTEQKKCENLRRIAVNLELLRHTGQNLRRLRMAGGRFFELKPDNVGHLAKLVNLTHLSMLDVNLGQENEAEWSFLKCLTNLKVLKIGSCIYWSSKTYEILSQLKNLESLCLEWGDTLPNDYLSHGLAVLPRLRHLHLVKFTISATLMSLIASKRQLATFQVWPRFDDPSAKQTWRNLVDGLPKQKFMQIFTLGIGSCSLQVLTDQSGENIVNQKGESLRFAAEDENNAGHIKSLHIDAFTRYAQNFVRYVINKYTKDESLFATRCN